MPLILDTQTNDAYELGAQLLTILAYPELAAGRQSVDEADGTRPSLREKSAWLCGLSIRAMAESFEGADRWQQRAIRAGYLVASEKSAQRQKRSFDYRRRDRSVAAHMAMPLLQSLEGVSSTYPETLRRLMKGERPRLNELAAWVADEDHVWENYRKAGMALKLGDRGSTNIKARIWRPTLPVLPLAAAVATAIHQYEQTELGRTGDHPWHLDWLTISPQAGDNVRYLVSRGEQFEPLVERLTEFRIKVPPLVRIRLA